MRILSIVAVSMLSLLATSPSRAQSATIDAVFERDAPSGATLSLSREGDGWRIALRAGGTPNGDATAADCEIEAVGPQDAAGVIAARIVPFEGELNAVSAADIGADELGFEVLVGPEGALVTDAGAAARLCGMGSDIEGFYFRTGMSD